MMTRLPALAACALLGAAAPAAIAQSADGGGLAPPGLADAPSPYYIGVSQSLRHDSNVYRVPFGPSDTYSTTSLLAGFEQPIGRQRLFGTATVGYNRYFDESRLSNPSYSLATGVDWETVMRLSGNVTATYDQRLSAPAASVGTTDTSRNLERRQGFSGVARWGGDSLLTLESRAGHSDLEYSGNDYEAAEAKNDYVSLGVFYRPSAFLRAGIALRQDSTRTAKAESLVGGGFAGNDARSRNIDLLADYDNGGFLTAQTRLSYTRLRNSNFDDADFSGFTGSIGLGYRATGRLSLNLGAARYTGYNGTPYGRSTAQATPISPIVTPTTPGVPGSTTTPVTAIAPNTSSSYENSQLTNAFSAGATYLVTSKISLSLQGRYSRARLVASGFSTSGDGSVNVTDKNRGATLSANYAYSRALTFGCDASRDRRIVSGAFGYGYTVDTFGCAGQFLWR